MTVKAWTPQLQGRAFEVDWAKIFGVDPVKGSGSFWYAKQDVRDGAVLWSLKYTEAKSLSVAPSLLYEVEAAIREFGYTDTLPGLAVSVQGQVFTILLADDMTNALTKLEPYITPTKAQARRQSASIPSLLR